MHSGVETWHQVVFRSPEGREEALWAQREGETGYRVLSVPVWVYGISRGSLVSADPDEEGRLRFEKLLAAAPGGTVRIVVPPGVKASEVYLGQIVPTARLRGLRIGPATFYNPRLVSVHLHERLDWWPTVGEFLDELVKAGSIQAWEVGDPDEYPDTPASITDPEVRILTHQLPRDGEEGTYTN